MTWISGEKLRRIDHMAMTQPKMTAEERKWRAQSDAETLARSKEIMSDPKRLQAAAKEAQTMAAEKDKEAKAMAKVAAKAPVKPQPKAGAKKQPKKVTK
jgi:hypothetical protein